jgi:hypothetical protein
MQAIAGSIVILAGSVLAGASVIAQELPNMNSRFPVASSGVAGVGGVFLILVGLVVLVTGMVSGVDRRRLPAAEQSSTRIRPAP